ncbi:MAG: hypothetical protein WCV93_01985 [Candidatus Shapirobacteria bacterium]|jgi:hypothetical protein
MVATDKRERGSKNERTLSSLVTTCGVTGGWVLAEIPGMGVARNIFNGVSSVEQVMGMVLTDGRKFVSDGQGGVCYSDEAGYTSLVVQLASNFASTEAVLRVGETVVDNWQRAGRVASGESYKAGLTTMMSVLADDVDRARLDLVVESLERSRDPIDGKRIVDEKALDGIKQGKIKFKPHFIEGTSRRGVSVFVCKTGLLGREIVGEKELKKIATSLEEASHLFGLDEPDKGSPIMYVVVPQWFLGKYAYVDEDRMVFLGASLGDSISFENVLKKEICDHENVHLVLSRIFGGHPPIPDLVEGVAVWVQRYMAGLRYEKARNWNNFLGKAVEKLKSETGVSNVSGTKILKDEGRGNAYANAFKMDVLVGVVVAMFPNDWVKMIKKMYSYGNFSQFNSRKGQTLIDSGVVVSGIRQRDILFELLAMSISDVDISQKRGWLRYLNEKQVPPQDDILPKFVEAIMGELLEKKK